MLLVSKLVSQSSAMITVWVHGTNPPPSLLLMSYYSPLRPWLYAKPGLSLALELPVHYYFHRLAKSCHEADPIEFPCDCFYTYGWPSTVLSAKTRQYEGIQLFCGIDAIVRQYRKKFDEVKVRVIGFSHGGNIILNMIQCLPFFCKNTELDVVFLGIPVQELTRSFINNAWVNRAFSFYSDADWMQVMDIQKMANWGDNVPWFSKKIFQDDDQIVQIKLTINGKSIGHREYRSYNQYVPYLLKSVKSLMSDNQKNGYFSLDFSTE